MTLSMCKSTPTAPRATVHTLIAGAAPNHDGTAVGAGRRILLVKARHAANVGHRRAAARRLRCDRDPLLSGEMFPIAGFLWLWLHDPDLLLRITVEELGRQPAENIVHNRLRHRDIGILRETGRLEPHMAELVH